MKHLYKITLATILSCCLFVSCGDSKEAPEPSKTVEQRLNGAWLASLVIMRHLDESCSIVAELRIPDETGAVDYYDNGISTFTIPPHNQHSKEYKYKIVERDGRHYIQYPTHEDEIVELTEEKLVWQRPYNNLYYQNEAGEWKKADRALEIYEYIRQ